MAPKIIAVTSDSEVVTPAQEIPSFFGVSSLSMSQKGGYKPTFSLDKFLPSSSRKKEHKKRKSGGGIAHSKRKRKSSKSTGVTKKLRKRHSSKKKR